MTRTTHILYVEDNADLREAVAELMMAPDRRVETCASAEQALDLCDTHDFDLVITDVSLPGLSGADLARRLAQTHPWLPVAICSGYDYGAHVAVLGPKVCSLPKPFEPEALDALLAETAPPPARTPAGTEAVAGAATW